MHWNWHLVEDQCTGCGICADVCPHDAITMAREDAMPRSGPEPCTGCMLCVDECPFQAVEVRELETCAG